MKFSFFIFFTTIKMSKKIIALSLLSLCAILCGCWVQNSTTNENQCIDDTCTEQNVKTAESRTTNKTSSEIESDITGFNENSGEIPVAEKTDWEPVVVQWQERSF